MPETLARSTLQITHLASFIYIKLHNPADVQVLAKDVANPTCIIYKSGVIFVAEESCLSYLDVGNVVALNPKALKKPRLQTELLKRQLLQPAEKATVA